MKKRRTGHNRRGRIEGPDPPLLYAAGALQSVDTVKKRRTGHNRQGRREGPDPHLEYAVGTLQSVDIVVGHPNSFGQALLMTLDQALAESIICPRIEDWKTWPMNLVQVHTLLIQSVKTALNTVAQSLHMLFQVEWCETLKHHLPMSWGQANPANESGTGLHSSDSVCQGYPVTQWGTHSVCYSMQDDVKTLQVYMLWIQCVSLCRMMWNTACLHSSDSVCQDYPAHSAVIKHVVERRMFSMWNTAAMMLASLTPSVQTTLYTVTQSSILFYVQDDVEQCSTGVTFSVPVCQWKHWY